MLPKTRINQQIRAQTVRVIDDSGGQIGVMPLTEALALATERELDLVEVSPMANPPVCKLIDYDKFRYQQKKLEALKKKNAKRVEVKTIRLSLRISPHDLEIKAKKANEFLLDGDMVKVEVKMRGREQAQPMFAFEQIKNFKAHLTNPHKEEVPPKKMGNTVSATYSPTK